MEQPKKIMATQFLKLHFFLYGLLFLSQIAFVLIYSDRLASVSSFLGFIFSFVIGALCNNLLALFVLSVVIYGLLFLLYLPAYFLPRYKVWAGKRLFFIVSSIVISTLSVILFVDIIYYGFYGSRLHFFFWDFIGDAAKIKQFFLGASDLFPFCLLLTLLFFMIGLLLFVWHWLWKRSSLFEQFVGTVKKRVRTSWVAVIFLAFLHLLFGYLFLTETDISPFANQQSADFVGVAKDNSLFALVRSYRSRRFFSSARFRLVQGRDISQDSFLWLSKHISSNSFVEKQGQSFAIRYQTGNYWQRFLKRRPKNIVLIVTEGLSAWPLDGTLGKQVAPNFLRIQKEGIYFSRHYHQGAGTIRNLQALIYSLGFPSAHVAFPFSSYAYKWLPDILPRLVKRFGLRSQFYYGSSYAESRLQYFLRRIGFDELYGKVHGDDENEVGDEKLFELLLQQLIKRRGPALHMILTSENHPPYGMPASFAKKTISLPAEVNRNIANRELLLQSLRSYRYADYLLGQFIASCRKYPFMRDTLFIITGDHHFRAGLKYRSQSVLRDSRVPLLLYAPQLIKQKGKIFSHFTSHFDLLPTIGSLLSSTPMRITSWGKSIFDQTTVAGFVRSSFMLYKKYTLADGQLYRNSKNMRMQTVDDKKILDKLQKMKRIFAITGLSFLYYATPPTP